MSPDELLVEMLIPTENLCKPSGFAKFGQRKALSLALVNAAARVEFNRDSGRFERVRLALGAVAPTPIRARMTEAFLEGKQGNEEILDEAGVIASGEARPIDDIRASAQYRRELIKVITRRVLGESLSG
jgi:carbon-monoxide dehydrogenase medium subunit